MLDDLRRSVDEDDDPFGFDDEDGDGAVLAQSDQQLLLGMTPIERMFLSIFLFMNVSILGLALLLVTGHIG